MQHFISHNPLEDLKKSEDSGSLDKIHRWTYSSPLSSDLSYGESDKHRESLAGHDPKILSQIVHVPNFTPAHHSEHMLGPYGSRQTPTKENMHYLRNDLKEGVKAYQQGNFQHHQYENGRRIHDAAKLVNSALDKHGEAHLILPHDRHVDNPWGHSNIYKRAIHQVAQNLRKKGSNE